METSDVRQVKKAQKNYRCDWCYEWIEKGTPYSTWFCYSERATARMHPECYEAMLMAFDYDLPTAGTFRRGCWCGERKEHCTCKTERGTE